MKLLSNSNGKVDKEACASRVAGITLALPGRLPIDVARKIAIFVVHEECTEERKSRVLDEMRGVCKIRTMTEHYENGDRYVGDCRNGQRHRGTYHFQHGDSFRGLWVCDDLHRTFSYSYANRDKYKGHMHTYHHPHGRGKMCPHGRGEMCYANGDVYKGYWSYGKRNLHGTMLFANGDVYEGSWEEDRRHGKGTHYFKNGDKCEGEWSDDKHAMGHEY